MQDRSRIKPLEKSNFFADKRSARPLVEGTVARGHLENDEHFFQGLVNGQPAEKLPFALTREVLLRGQERFNIYCSVCHDRAGTGNGMIVQRGYPKAADYQEERLRGMVPGHIFRVISDGLGNMPSYREQIPAKDRWAIAAYVKTLQVSQRIDRSELSPEEVSKLEGSAE